VTRVDPERKRTVLVTGASRNIGRHLAIRFGEAGYNVVACARNSETLEPVAAGIREGGGSAIGIPADVADPNSVESMFSKIENQFGGVDILINNAVARVVMPIEEMTFDQWRLTLGVTLDAAFNCSKAAVPFMRANSWGRIINVAGKASFSGTAKRVGLNTAKSGIIGFTRGMARELGPDGITVNAVSPGRIDTERGDWTAVGDVKDAMARYERGTAEIAVGRMGTLDEVTSLFLYLSSDSAAFITGDVISVNGGSLIR